MRYTAIAAQVLLVTLSSAGAVACSSEPPCVAEGRYCGPLCGPPGHPCTVQVHETLSATNLWYDNGAPDVAVDELGAPWVLYSAAYQGYRGFLARRAPTGVWASEETPFAMARGDLVVQPDGRISVLANAGDTTAALYSRSPDPGAGWDAGDPLPGRVSYGGGALDRRADGSLVAVASIDGSPTLAEHAGAWSLSSWAAPTGYHARLAVSSTDTVQVVYWTSQVDGWGLVWRTPQGSPETVVVTDNSLNFGEQWVSLALGPPSDANPQGQPHVLFVTSDGPGDSLVWVRRLEQNHWSAVEVAAEPNDDTELCRDSPVEEGLSCRADYHELVPMGVVASQSGPVRFLYANLHITSLEESRCDSPFGCSWYSIDTHIATEIRLAWPVDDHSVASSVLSTSDERVRGASVLVDRWGHLHAAYYAYQPDYRLVVRYLRLRDAAF